jgi:hypothetical protein
VAGLGEPVRILVIQVPELSWPVDIDADSTGAPAGGLVLVVFTTETSKDIGDTLER